jgi:hypothetical protein
MREITEGFPLGKVLLTPFLVAVARSVTKAPLGSAVAGKYLVLVSADVRLR